MAIDKNESKIGHDACEKYKGKIKQYVILTKNYM